MSSSVEQVQDALHKFGLDIEIIEFEQSTRTAGQAAAAINTKLGSIVKSLVFIADDEPALVLVAGDQRADVEKISRVLGMDPETVGIADADTVREATGFTIGGVPPVGHSADITVVIDRTLARYETVYAAAGSPRHIFPIGFETLVEITAGQVAHIAE